MFGLCQIYAFVDYIRSKLTKEQFDLLFRTLAIIVGATSVTVFSVLTLLGSILYNTRRTPGTQILVLTLPPGAELYIVDARSVTQWLNFRFFKLRMTPRDQKFSLTLTPHSEISPWTGRFYSLLDPSYAKNNIPIIASVSEHQPTSWSSFYFDLQLHVFMFPGNYPRGKIFRLAPLCSSLICPSSTSSSLLLPPLSSPLSTVGLYFCFSKLTDQNIFIILYGVTSIYFAVRHTHTHTNRGQSSH